LSLYIVRLFFTSILDTFQTDRNRPTCEYVPHRRKLTWFIFR